MRRKLSISRPISLTFAQDIAIFRKIEQLIDKFDDSNLKLSQNEDGSPQNLSCHMLTQALARMPMREGLRACSGYYLPSYEHSWLVSKKRLQYHILESISKIVKFWVMLLLAMSISGPTLQEFKLALSKSLPIYKTQAIRLPPQSAEVFHARI